MAKDNSSKPEIQFFDLKNRKNKDKAYFKTTNYEVREKSGRFFAVTKAPSGEYECWKVLSKIQAAEIKKAS